jgi:hypothetical protein
MEGLTTQVSQPPIVAQHTPGLLDLPGCEFTPTSLILPPDLSYDHWERIGRQLQLANLAVQWWIGDWLVYGEHKWREKYAQAVQQFGRAEQTLMNYAFVAKAISPSRRREQVDFSTHAEVAGLDEEDQERILSKAANEGSTRKQVRREVERTRKAKQPMPADDALVMSKQSRQFLDDYMTELALWPDKIPAGIAEPEREVLEKMIYDHGADALRLKKRTRQSDCEAIVRVMNDTEAVSHTGEMAAADLFVWMENLRHFITESEFKERLEYMNQDGVRMALLTDAGEDGRQEGRRGALPGIVCVPWRKVWNQSAKRERDEDDD